MEIDCEKFYEFLLEYCADIEPQRWARWQQYIHTRGMADRRMGTSHLRILMDLIAH